jgi:hypothetical protein
MTNIQISYLENYGSLMETINPCSQFLICLRVNEIPNKTFILDSHRPFLCSVVYSLLYSVHILKHTSFDKLFLFLL